MKKVLIFITFLIVVLGYSSNKALSDTNIERGYISVSTSANAEIAPDVAEISIAVQTYDNESMQKATLQNKEISDKVINALKVMINSENGDYIKTSNFSASPIYVYSNNKRNFDKYQVSNSVIIHTKSIDKVGAMIDQAIALGATNVNSLSFSVSNYETQCDDLLAIASKRAKNRADVVARAVPVTVSGVRTLDISCSANNSYRPQYRMLKSNAVMDGATETASSTTIESGVIKIYANVNASYFVK